MGLIGSILAGGIGAVAGGGVGAVGGAAFGGNTAGANSEELAKTGAITGALGGAAIGAIVGSPISTGAALGGVALDLANISGGAIIGGAQLASEAGGFLAKNVLNPVAEYGAIKYSKRAAGIGKALVKSAPDSSNLLKTKMTGLGTGLVFGSGILNSSVEAFNSFNRNRMGRSDGMVTRATPRTPSYSNNAGATGDLVFAMNKNRRG